MEDMTRLVVHCSDSPNDREVDAAEIHRWHLERGWDGIGYHKVILRDGTVENGRPEYWKGSHVGAYNNNSLGVCLIGRDEFTKFQMTSLYYVLDEWKRRYPQAMIMGHCDLDSGKSCPNFDVAAFAAQWGMS